MQRFYNQHASSIISRYLVIIAGNYSDRGIE
jgi:hypothetical protein